MMFADTPQVRIAYEAHGPADGTPVILLHGFPYDVRAHDEVAPPLAAQGCRVIVPYLRGFGPTRLREGVMRSGQQAALGADLLALMDALAIPQAVLAGYDWGGRAASVVAALWPKRVRGLVTCGGYNIQDIAGSVRPADAATEHRWWYQYYLHTERGRAGLAADRRGFCQLLWRLWSPTWAFDEATFERTAVSFDNPDFVDVVVHSYRHRFGYMAGDPGLEGVEGRLAGLPEIGVPTIALYCGADGVAPTLSEPSGVGFGGNHRSLIVEGAGHNVPQEKPGTIYGAVCELMTVPTLIGCDSRAVAQLHPST